jgi:antitoxin ParD1/3/4
MNVSLPPELERLVNEKVASGLYDSASDVVRDALRLLRDRDEVRSLALTELRKDVMAGIEELDRGESAVLDIAAIKAQARRRIE